MLAAPLVWPVYLLLLRRRPPDLPQDVALAGSIVAALALLTPALVITGLSLPIAIKPGGIAAILYIATFASLVAFLL